MSNLSQAKFKQAVQSKRFPTLPEVAQRLIEIAKQPDPDTSELCQVIKSDPALSAKILKTVNSAIFAFRPRVETIENAVPRLGTSLIRTLILSFHLSTIDAQKDPHREFFQNLWCSCLTQAVVAEILATKSGNDPAFCFMAAMLQDLGILALAGEFFDEYNEHVLANCRFPNVVASEREHFGFSHVEVTTEILKQWNLETTFGRAVRKHHDTVSSVWNQSGNPEPAVILQAANLGADLIVNRQNDSAGKEQAMSQWFGFLGTHFDFTEEPIDLMFAEIKDRIKEYSVIYKFDVGSPPDVQKLMADANEMLHEIAIDNQINLLTRTAEAPKKKPQDNELYRDYQTDLYNRRFLSEHLFQEIEKWLRRKKPLALMFIDIDKFKQVNDRHGHATGDDAIDHVGQWLQKNLRKSDYAIRLGGDEFLVVMQAREKHFRTIAERICDTVPALKLDEDQQIDVSLSIGGIYYTPTSVKPLDINFLIASADQIMYRVKRQGGNKVMIYKMSEASVPTAEFRELPIPGLTPVV